MSNTNRRVVVTGMGALTPIGLNVNDFWNGMMESKSGSALIKQFDTSKVETKFACELKGFDVLNFLDRKICKTIRSICTICLVATQQAVDDGNI